MPVVVDSLAAAIERSLIVLLIGSVLVMAATLALVFRSPHRLLPLVLALGAAAVSFGLVALAGARADDGVGRGVARDDRIGR